MSEKAKLADSMPRWLDLRPLGLIACAIAAVLCTQITTTTYHSIKVKPEKRTIKVIGSAKKRIVSDLIEWEASLEARASDRTSAYKTLREHSAKAVAMLESQGIKTTEIQPQSATFEEEFELLEEYKLLPGAKVPTRLEKRISKGYVTRQAIIVRSTDVPRVEKASREITSLLEQGVSITSSAPAYFYTRLGELKVEMLAAAGKDARARADNILKSTGGAGIKRLLDANMGIININPANSTETSHEGNNDRSSFEKDIITIVRAEFELD
ncbi:MAG: SIMPL domain-containing protein [Deltaproteobacteria bacterium]|nr:SIMPL domain-containing protein [Deltaproteobacteria bacterium]MDQ3299303.1 SIMPL domain-containing protein [Myxococcota bacterium]